MAPQYPLQRPDPVNHDDISEARFKRFLHDLRTYERQVVSQETLDMFLESYSFWMKSHEPWLKLQLVTLAFELHRLDPDFTCTLAFKE